MDDAALFQWMADNRANVSWTAHNLKAGGSTFHLNTLRKNHGEDPKAWLRAAITIAALKAEHRKTTSA